MSRTVRSTELSLIGLAILLSLAIVAIGSGAADAPGWLPERAPDVHAHEQAPIPRAATPSLQSLANTWQRPLFSPDRSPDHATAKTAAATLVGLTLTGVLIQGDLRVAWFKPNDGPALTLHQGQSLPNGWRLENLTSVHADFTFQGHRQRIERVEPRLPPPSTTPPISLPHESTP